MSHRISRRRFLTTAAAVIPASLSRNLPAVRGGKAGAEAVETEKIWSPRFIPSGRSCKIAFVADHHYWPDHKKNWGGGTQQTIHSRRRMQDLLETLNLEAPRVSIHGGDVIDSGSAFHPPREEYLKQLEFEKEFLSGLRHTVLPLVGNHEVPDSRYEHEAELRPWRDRFGPCYRFHDTADWRLIGLNSIQPNPGAGTGKGILYGIDPVQMAWLRRLLENTEAERKKALLFSHIPPRFFNTGADFEKILPSFKCVKGMFCGHTHRNTLHRIGDIPVMERVGNAMSPLGYSLIHPFPDGRIIVVQKSQHFPFLDFMSSSLRAGAQGEIHERHFTLGGSSKMPLTGMRVIGRNARARIHDGFLRLDSFTGDARPAGADNREAGTPKQRAALLFEQPEMKNARLDFSAVMEKAERMGAFFSAAPDGRPEYEAVVTTRETRDGHLYIARPVSKGPEILARSWFNIQEGIAYRLRIEVRDGSIRFMGKNLPPLSVRTAASRAGRFGLFVENGTLLVTDLRIQKL